MIRVCSVQSFACQDLLLISYTLWLFRRDWKAEVLHIVGKDLLMVNQANKFVLQLFMRPH